MRYEVEMNKVVSKFGLEDDRTQAFFELCEYADMGADAWEAIESYYAELMAVDVYLTE